MPENTVNQSGIFTVERAAVMLSLIEDSLLVMVIVEDGHSLARAAIWYSVHSGRAVQCEAMAVRRRQDSKKQSSSAPARPRPRPQGHGDINTCLRKLATTAHVCAQTRRFGWFRAVVSLPRMSMSVSDQPACLVSGCVCVWFLRSIPGGW